LPETVKLPDDIPWRWAGHVLLPAEYFHISTFGPAMPSIGLFYYIVPRAESEKDFPYHKIVLLKAVVTLSGISWGWDDPTGLTNGISGYAPCIGARLDLSLSYSVARGGQTDEAGLFVRDVFPKHQEMVVNEIIGQETLERATTRVSSTKSWNTNIGLTIPKLGLGVSAGSSDTTTTESENERSQRNSRQTQVEHTYHVLTAYHLGGPNVSFTIQPRPFEGESWELVNGFRILEGIQEFLVFTTVPLRAKELSVGCQLYTGFRTRNLLGPDQRGNLGLPTQPDHPLPMSGTYPHGGQPNQPPPLTWETWKSNYVGYLAMLEFWEQQVAPPAVFSVEFGSLDRILLYRDNPCDDAGLSPFDLDPCTVALNPTTGREFLSQSHPATAKHVEAHFREIAVPKPSPALFADIQGSTRRAAANAHVRDLFHAFLATTRASKSETEFHKTNTFKSAVLWNLMHQPEVSGLSLNRYIGQLDKEEQETATRFKVQTLRHLVFPPAQLATRESVREYKKLQDAVIDLVARRPPAAPTSRRTMRARRRTQRPQNR
jgi:hypothetical protein